MSVSEEHDEQIIDPQTLQFDFKSVTANFLQHNVQPLLDELDIQYFDFCQSGILTKLKASSTKDLSFELPICFV